MSGDSDLGRIRVIGRPSKYPDELRERAVRMVAEVRPQYLSQWAAITAVAGMLGIGTPETLRTWIRRFAELDVAWEAEMGRADLCDRHHGQRRQQQAGRRYPRSRRSRVLLLRCAYQISP